MSSALSRQTSSLWKLLILSSFLTVIANSSRHCRCEAFLSPTIVTTTSRLSKFHSVTTSSWRTNRIIAKHEITLLPNKMSRNGDLPTEEEGDDEQVMEALQSLGDFHQGSWKGKATSFTVTADVAAGIVQKKTSPEYQLDVQLMFTESGSPAWQEVCSWESDSGDDGGSDGGDNDSSNDKVSFASSRLISFAHSSVDCDAVDASYSLHTRQAAVSDDNDNDDNEKERPASNFPAELVGTSKASQFAVEHCMAVSDDARVRMLALYGEKQELIRVVICDEERKETEDAGLGDTPTTSTQLPGASSNAFTAADLLELQSDVDRLVDKISEQVSRPEQSGKTDNGGNNKNSGEKDIDYDPAKRMQQLQDLQSSMGTTAGMNGTSPLQQLSSTSSTLSPTNFNKKSDIDRGPALVRHPMSLLELTSGVWLGDSIIRDNPSIPGDGSNKAAGSGKAGKGFGMPKSKSETDTNKQPSFGRWATGVQKVAREWLWDFGEQIRQNNDAGKCLGANMEAAMGQSMAGSVCENQSLSRRIPKEDRMVYIDWNDGNGDNHVGFIVGSVSIQV